LYYVITLVIRDAFFQVTNNIIVLYLRRAVW